MITKILAFCTFLTLSLLSSFSFAEESIAWQTWSPAVFEQAKAQHKYVFIYGKVEWCHWCKAMNTTTFQSPEVIAELNKHYIAVKVDLDKDRELAKHYRIRGLPTLLVLDEQDRIIKVFTGYYLPGRLEKQLIKFAPLTT